MIVVTVDKTAGDLPHSCWPSLISVINKTGWRKLYHINMQNLQTYTNLFYIHKECTYLAEKYTIKYKIVNTYYYYYYNLHAKDRPAQIMTSLLL